METNKTYTLEEIKDALAKAAIRSMDELLDTGKNMNKLPSPSTIMAMTMYSSVLSTLFLDELTDEKE